MHEIIAKVARFAVSKFAAFCYAVAVGVAGNLALNFVQLHHQASAPVAQVGEATGAGSVVNQGAAPAVAPDPLSRGGGDPAPIHTSPRATPSPESRQVGPAAAVPALPEPPAVTLPSPAALALPPFKPAVLPSEAAQKPMATPPAATALAAPDSPVAAPAEPARSPPEMPPHGTPAGDAAPPASPPVAALPPLAPAIDVAAPPTPPAGLPAPPTRVTALPGAARSPEVPAERTTPSKQSSGGLELSDVWHPGRAFDKGLHWAGRQVPLIGDGDPEPHAEPQAAVPKPSAPIPLLPPAAEAASSDNTASPRKPAAPGPGHGGLY